MLFFPLLFLWVVPLVVIVWGVVDAASHPTWAWDQAGQNKTLWIVLQVVGFFFCLVGLILSIVYLAAIAPKVRLVERGMGGAVAGYGGPYAGGPTAAPPWTPPPPPGPAPGWYPDADRAGGTRYWDGTRWTEDRR